MTYPGISPEQDPDRAAVEQRRKEREIEFSTYVATKDIPWGSVTAFYVGEIVPKSTVEARGWLDLDLVAKVGTKAAGAATGGQSESAKSAAGSTSSKSTKSESDS